MNPASETDSQEEPRLSAGDYCKAIRYAERAFDEWNRVSDNADKALSNLHDLADGTGDRQMQVFWANWEYMRPSIYARPPLPVVTGRFKTARDQLYRDTSETLERCVTTSLEDMDIDHILRQVTDDLIANGRGVTWVRYVAEGETEEDFVESVCVEHIDRTDFLHEPGRKWEEVGWVARRSWMTKAEIKDRFKGTDCELLTYQKVDDDKDELSNVRKAAVYEIWDRVERRVVWVHDGLDDVLDQKEPPLSLKGFFPTPRPVYSTLQRRTLVPVPDYVYIRDQLDEINDLTARIASMSESLRLCGFIPGGDNDIAEAVKAALAEADDRAVLVPVSNFAAFGGTSLKESLVWLPLDMVIQAIEACLNLRRQLIDDVYQISGISDIQRGDSDPNETLGAQQLKAQNGATRIRSKQNEIVRYARDLIVMIAEIIAEEFSVETIALLSQSDLPRRADIERQMQELQGKIAQAAEMAQRPEAQAMVQQNPQAAQQIQQQLQQAQGQLQELAEAVTLDDVCDLLGNEKLRPFVLDVESDSTIQPDEQAEKASRAEFTQAIAGLLHQAVPAVQQVPQLAPLVGETIRFNASAFRQGRQLMDEIDDFVDKLKNGEIQMQQPDEGKGDEGKAEVERMKVELEGKKLEMDQQRAQMEMQIAQQKAGIEGETARQKLETERAQAEIDAEAKRGEMVRDQQRFAADMEMMRANLLKTEKEIERIEAQAKAAARKPELSHGRAD